MIAYLDKILILYLFLKRIKYNYILHSTIILSMKIF